MLSIEIQSIADEIASCAIVAIERAIGVEDGVPGVVAPEEPDDFDNAAYALLAALNKEQRLCLSSGVQRSLSFSSRERSHRFGKLAEVNLGLKESVSDQLNVMPFARRFVARPGGSAVAANDKAVALRYLAAVRNLRNPDPVDTPPDPMPTDLIGRENEIKPIIATHSFT